MADGYEQSFRLAGRVKIQQSASVSNEQMDPQTDDGSEHLTRAARRHVSWE